MSSQSSDTDTSQESTNMDPGYQKYLSFLAHMRSTAASLCQIARLTKPVEETKPSPFDYIADASMALLHDPIRGIEALARRMDVEDKQIRQAVATGEADPEDDATWAVISGLFDEYRYLYKLSLQIINVAITKCLELLDDVGFSPAEIPWENNVDSRAQFLQTLLGRSVEMHRLDDDSQDGSCKNARPVCDNPDFGYEEQLDSSAGEIRVAIIAPGTGDDPIHCQLETRRLDTDVLKETLSYVWGPPEGYHNILVNGKEFNVRDSLFRAFKGLRRPDVPREIWADALCINQADNAEKVGQIKLMRRIYANTQKATIWLGDDTPEIEEEFPFDDVARPLTEWLDEPATNEDDLTSMLDLCRALTSELAPGLKSEAHGRLEGDEAEAAARKYRHLHKTAILHKVSPVSTFVADLSREFITTHATGLALPLARWFRSYEQPSIIWKRDVDVPDTSAYHLNKMFRYMSQGHLSLLSEQEDEGSSSCDGPCEGELWAGKLMAATVYLSRCVRSVLSHSWWERMWVLQESYLPHISPEFHFGGVRFSWDDLSEARDIAKEMELALKWNHHITLQKDLDALSGMSLSNSFLSPEKLIAGVSWSPRVVG